MRYQESFLFSLVLIVVGLWLGSPVVEADPYNPAHPDYDPYLNTLRNNADYWRREANQTLLNGSSSSRASDNPQRNSPRNAQCKAELNQCEEPCLTQMGGKASEVCDSACWANYNNCTAGDTQRQNMGTVMSNYQRKQECDNLLTSCQVYTCDKFHGMRESQACMESCRAQADQCMAARGLAPQPTRKTVMISPLTPQEREWFEKLPFNDAIRFIMSKLTPEEREFWATLSAADRARLLMCKTTRTEC
jgi:hypothetical protein